MDSDDELFLNDWDDSSQDYSDTEDDYSMDSSNYEANKIFDPPDEYLYEILSETQIEQFMKNSIEEVKCIIQLSNSTVRTLLDYFKWDKEKLLREYYDGDQDRLFADANIRIANDQLTNRTHIAGLSPKCDKETCEICCEIVMSDTMVGLECHPRFCGKCWNEYITIQIMDEGLAETISCAAQGCDILVDETIVIDLIKNPDVKSKYCQILKNRFIQFNKFLRWCSASNCNNVVRVTSVECYPVTCSCSHTFCFACGENWHEPLRCHLLKQWLEEDVNTIDWIEENSKRCPECRMAIVKTGGCNVMKCKNPSCRTTFCWICLNISGYDHHCNRYNEQNKKRKVKTVRLRYAFFFERHSIHMQSLKFERQLNKSLKDRLKTLQKTSPWIEAQFFENACKILLDCRQTLMYTYVFAYYLKKNNQSLIFENNQSDLEIATEKLSNILESNSLLKFPALVKPQVQDIYRYCDKRRKILVEHVYEGYEHDWWEYIL